MFTSKHKPASIRFGGRGKKTGNKEQEKGFLWIFIRCCYVFRLQSSNNKMKESEHIKKSTHEIILNFNKKKKFENIAHRRMVCVLRRESLMRF